MLSTKLESSLFSWGKAGLLIFVSAFLWSPSRDGLHIIYFLSFFIPCALLIPNNHSFRQLGGHTTLLALLFAGYSALTSIWGNSSDLFYFLFQWIALSIWLCGVCILLPTLKSNLDHLLAWFIVIGVFVILISIAHHYYLYGPFTSSNRLVGINAFRNSNEIGAMSGVVSLLAFMQAMYTKNSLRVFLFLSLSLLAFLGLIASFSRGALLSFIVTFIFSILVTKPNLKILIGLFSIVVSSSVIMLIFTNVDMYIFRGNIEDLGGRHMIWKGVLEQIRENFWFGIGLARDSSIMVEGTIFNHAHSGWIDTMYRVGIVGVLLIIFHLTLVGKAFHRNPVIEMLFFWLFYGLVFNFFDGQIFFWKLGAKWFFYWIPIGLIVAMSIHLDTFAAKEANNHAK